MELTELPESTIAANVEELENLFLRTKIDFRWAMPKMVDDAIEILAKYGKETTILTMSEAEELAVTYYGDHLLVRTMSELYAMWIDPKVFIGRDDNLLSREIKIDDSWQARFKQSMTEILLDKGTLVSYDASYFSWEEYDNIPTAEIIGVFNLHTDEWGKFEGTFAPEQTHTGITAEVLYANGLFRRFRYETDLATIMREL